MNNSRRLGPTKYLGQADAGGALKIGKQIAVVAIVVISAALLTSCLATQDGGSDSAASPLLSDQVQSNQENSGQTDNVGAQSSQTPISGKHQDADQLSQPKTRQPALSSTLSGPGPEILSESQQWSRTLDQVAGGATAIAPEQAQSAQAAPTSALAPPSSTPSASPSDAPLQSSRAVEVNVGKFRQLLRRDAIAPIYAPQFLPANRASLNPGELVIGVAIDGESKAYPIGHLAWREMVNDVIAGVPILVTW